jgi:UDP-glucose 6-dehydrogenase
MIPTCSTLVGEVQPFSKVFGVEGFESWRRYKKNVSDCRNPALDVMRMLTEKGAVLSYNDPFVTALRMNGNTLKSVELTSAYIESQDCIIILTDHSDYDFRRIIAASKLVVDTRNATKDLQEFKDKIIKLGAGNNVVSAPNHESELESVAANLATH